MPGQLSSIISAVQSSFNSWQGTPNNRLSFNYITTTSSQKGNDNYNVVFWTTDLAYNSLSSSTVATCHIYDDGGIITEVDIAVNDLNYTWSLNTFSFSNIQDIQSIITHEIGHLCGIDHSWYFADCPTMMDGNSWKEHSNCRNGAILNLEMRSLAPSDQSAIQYLYGAELKVPEIFKIINDAATFATSGQTIKVTPITTCSLNDVCTVKTGVTLQIANNSTINLNGFAIKFAAGSSLSGSNITWLPSNNIKVYCGGSLRGIYSTISMALDSASSGETVVITNGNYSVDGLVVKSGVTLQVNSGAVLTFSPGSLLMVNGVLNANNATFQGNGALGSWGGIILQSAGSSIYSCAIRDASNGISAHNIYSASISYNRFTNCNIGFNFTNYSSINVLPNNIFSGNNWDVYGDGSSTPNLGIAGGYNSFRNPGYYQVYSQNFSNTVFARGNYWSGSPLITANVDASNPLPSDPNPLPKRATINNSENPELLKQIKNKGLLSINKESPSKSKFDNANILFFSDKFSEALPIYETLINDNPDNITGEISLVFMERCLEKLERKNETMDMLNNLSIKKSGKKISKFAGLRKIYQYRNNGDIDNALVQAKNVLKTADDSTHIKMLLYDIGNLYYFEKKDKSAAEVYYRELIKQYPYDILSSIALNFSGESKPENWEIKEIKPKQIIKMEEKNINIELSNYPNPFNPETTISYSIPKDGFVSLKVYDVIGREIKSLINQNKSAGIYSVIFSASNLSSGIYYYRLNFQPVDGTKGVTINKSMQIIK